MAPPRLQVPCGASRFEEAAEEQGKAAAQLMETAAAGLSTSRAQVHRLERTKLDLRASSQARDRLVYTSRRAQGPRPTAHGLVAGLLRTRRTCDMSQVLEAHVPDTSATQSQAVVVHSNALGLWWSWPPGRARMAATLLLPTLSPPVSRAAAAAFLLRRAPLKPSHYLHRPRTLCRSLSPSYPATLCPALSPLSTMPSTAAARAVPARRDLLMLGIETSCDDTAAAVVRGDGEILSQVVSSQADLLARYGGVAPKMAEEAHALVIDQVVQKALDDAKLSESDLSAVAVTIGPGLSLCLRVGVHKARQVAKVFGLPIVGVHHMEAHALVSRLVNKDLDFPFLALLISDDAIGEAYDKSARWLGLDMRKGGGPALEELALEGDPNAVKFRVPMRQHKDCNFSYAGLKTQVRLAIESKNLCTEDVPISSALEEDRQSRANIAASFQRVAVLHLEERCQRAVEWALKMEPSIKYFVVSGGVASNKYVRTRLNQVAENNGLQLVSPPPSLCTDNGVMIAWTGIEHFVVGRFENPPTDDEPDDMQYELRPRWPLGEEYSEGRSVARSLKTARVHPSLTSMIQGSLQK